MGYRVGMVIWNTGDRTEQHGRATLMTDLVFFFFFKNFRAIKNQQRLSADKMIQLISLLHA